MPRGRRTAGPARRDAERLPRAPATPRLSPERAFVVQLEHPLASSRRAFRGRVEHLASGDARHFRSLAALLAFMDRFG
jgi:hypothetical protein